MVWILKQQSLVKRKEWKEDKIEKKQKKKVSGYREVKEMASKESAVRDEEHQKWHFREAPMTTRQRQLCWREPVIQGDEGQELWGMKVNLRKPEGL